MSTLIAITPTALHEWLKGMGIVREPGQVKRVVIDAAAGDLLRVYIEEYGGEEVLTVAPLVIGGVKPIEVSTSCSEQD